MYFIFKLTVVILILYLKLNGLNAIPLIEHHKLSLLSSSTASSATSAAAAANAAAPTLSLSKQPNDKNISTVAATTATATPTQTPTTTFTTNSSIKSTLGTETATATTKTAAINALTINANNLLPLTIPTTSIATATTTATAVTTTVQQQQRHKQLSDNRFFEGGILFNYLPINKDKTLNSSSSSRISSSSNNNNRHNNDNNQMYNYYDVAAAATTKTTANDHSKRNQQQSHKMSGVLTASANPTKPPYINDLLPFDPKSSQDESSIPNSSDGDDANDNEINDDIDVISDELDMGLGNILLNTFNTSDVNRFLLKYDSDEGNTCLLDVVKDSLMWWSNKNGTLRGDAIYNFTEQRSYLDLSFRNITADDRLYGKTRAYTYWHGPDVIAFSAAQNNLTHAPYRTLSLLNRTLKYLTLKGNQFASYTTEMQKDAINRILNDTTRHSDNSNNITTLEDEPSDENTHTTPNTPMATVTPNYTENTTTQIGAENDKENEEEEEGGDVSFEHFSKRRQIKKYKKKVFGKTDEGIAWATFPPMPALLELDISNCHIEYIARDAFRNLTSLRRLFLAHNKMLTIPADSFHHIPSLQYLDLSFTNVLDSDFQIPLPTIEAVYNLIYGVKIQQKTFQALPNLVYLDLSHTKLTRNSAMAFTHLGEKLRYMSLCYTSFPMVGNALFRNTALVGLDLSGNPYAAYNMIEDAFEGVKDTLKYLYFERSNIKDLTWLRYLGKLRVLALSGNNINSVSLDVFSPLKSLQLLDLSSNHIGNWYNRVFTHNEQLRVLNLRDNNVNIITSEMLRDFQLLDYLSLGDNNFVCDCLLRDLVDIAAANNKDAECSRNVLQEATEILMDNAYMVEDYITPNVTLLAKQRYQSFKFRSNANAPILYDMSELVLRRQMPALDRSYKNMQIISRHRPKIRYVSSYYSVLKTQSSTNTQCPEPEPIIVHDKLNSSSLKFQLLDYEDDHYWCFNETERLNFMQLNCQSRLYVDDLTRRLHTLTKYVVGSVVSFLGLSLLGVLLYLKRWHIHYYFSYLKSAALVSVAAKEASDQLNSLAETDPNLVYDIFISYCQSDRQWVLEELLPNVEESGDISICMHERDFQIGLTILDNIVSCMDRSRTLMLIISSNFLLSHWCQFEMHLAQHRIFEVSKEHLILVFLEDIPRSKRPKTLQYLMEVKTYIKWPSNGDKTPSADERKFFWKRLKRSLENIGLHPYPKPKESHA